MQEEKEIRFFKGNDSYQEEFVDFINYVFHMNGKDDDFYRLLPKIYKKEYHPCQYNYMVTEEGHIKAAVGSFPGEVTVCRNTLTYEGIGNVAVHPYARSKGYMKKLMNQAVEDMLGRDVDFSVLAGRRNRYAYFSYEVVGRKYKFWMDEANIKHRFGQNNLCRFQFVLVKEENEQVLSEILQLHSEQPLSYKREQHKQFDILNNWRNVDIYAIFEKERFAGYLLFYNKDNVKEILLKQEEDLLEVLSEFYNKYVKTGFNIELPDYQRKFINSLADFAESVTVEDKDNFSVFHYEKVIQAFLTLKSQSDKLADGEITLNIHGKKRDEKLLISVKDNKVEVKQTDTETEYEYNHLEAMSLLFGNYSPLRGGLPFNVQSWLPLPIYIFPADEV